MRLKRCAALQVALDEQPRFDVATLFAGGDGLVRAPRWIASAPEVAEPREVTLAGLAVLAGLRAGDVVRRADLAAAHGDATIDALVDAGLLQPQAGDAAPAGEGHGDVAADGHDIAWWPPALHAQLAGRWHGVDIAARQDAGQMPDSAGLVAALGPAPSHEQVRRAGAPALALPAPRRSAFDELLDARRTCRNFDPAAVLPAATLSTMLHRVWSATGTRELAPGAVAVRKSSPAGGGLHAVEATLLVQRAEGLAPGLYHYLPLRHALEPLRTMTAADARTLAHAMLAGQHWFVDTPVLVVMTARFDRLFWKYQRHAKAWRVVHLDVGHLSQTMYLAAADLGLGAFVTAAINDGDIGETLGLAPLREAAIAIVGFGARLPDGRNIEMDRLEPTPAARLARAD